MRRRVGEVFDLLGRGEWEEICRRMTPDVHHVFPGEHPLGGERRSREAVLRWFGRLGRLYPGHEFEVHDVVVRGAPWDLTVAARWTARLTPAAGPAYDNDGSHWLWVRGGRLAAFHAYLDTQAIADACRLMGEAGIEEAIAAPIVD